MLDIFGSIGKQGEGDKKGETPDYNKINENISALNDSLKSITGRLDDFDTRLNEFSQPEEEEQDEEKFNPSGKTWDDVRQTWVSDAEEIVNEKLSERDEQAKEEAQAKEDQAKQIDTYIETQLSTLEKEGTIPKVEKADDEQDKGRVARREILGLAAHLGTIDIKSVKSTLDTLHKAGYTYDPKANGMQGGFLKSEATPSGISAPVGSSSKSGGFTSGKPDYAKIHAARDLGSLIRDVTGE